ncbi:MAG: hypothetical protein ACKKL4_02495 [Patescibacteria group bacterium]
MAHRLQRVFLLICILFVGLFGVGVLMAQAQTPTTGAPTAGIQNVGTGQETGSSDTSDKGASMDPSIPKIGTCGDTWSSYIGSCLTGGIVYLSALILIGAGAVFDVFINFTLNPEFYNMPYIRDAWIIMRDLANMAFILGIIAAALMMITGFSLKQGNMGWKEVLTRLIIIALLLNFSFFFSRAIIDAGNIMGKFFYTQITETTPSKSAVSEKLGSKSLRVGSGDRGADISLANVSSPSAPIVRSLLLVESGNVDGILSIQTVKDIVAKGEGYVMALNVIILTVAVVAGWSLFKTGFMFITRTLYLIILIIISPLAFVSYFIPNLNGFQSWLSHMFNKSFCVCVYLFLIYLLLLILGPVGGASGLGGGTTDLVQTVIIVVINLGFIFGILGVANSKAQAMCEGGGGIGSRIQSSITGVAGIAAGGALGAGAMIGKKTIGGGMRASVGNWGRHLSRESEYTAEKLRSNKWHERALGNVLYTVGDAAANAKFGMAESNVARRTRKGNLRTNTLDNTSKNLRGRYEEEEHQSMINSGLDAMMRGASGQHEIENERAKLKPNRTKRLLELEQERGGFKNKREELEAKRQVNQEEIKQAEQAARESLRSEVEKQIDTDELANRTNTRLRAENKSLLEKNDNWFNWTLDGGVGGYAEAAQKYEIVEGGDKKTKGTKNKQIYAREQMAAEARNKINKMDSISHKLLRNLTNQDMGLMINTKSIKEFGEQFKQNNEYKNLDALVKNAFTSTQEGPDGKPREVFDSKNYQDAMNNFMTTLHDVKEEYADKARDAVKQRNKAQQNLELLQSSGSASDIQIERAEKSLKDATRWVESIQSSANREAKRAQDQLVGVAKAKFQAKGEATTSMDQATLMNVYERGYQAESAAEQGLASDVATEDVNIRT